jgi:hypothetical protein
MESIYQTSSRQTSKFNTSSNKIYTYFIESHGEISQIRVDGVKKFLRIMIPPKVEIFTYTKLGNVASHCNTNTSDYVCKKKNNQTNIKFEEPTQPYFKYIRQFPEMRFEMDEPNEYNKLNFYSGIVHCIPKTRDDGSTKTKEIIHNMDADPDYPGEACSNKSIHPYYYNTDVKGYNSDKNYSTSYKTVLATNKHLPTREPPLEKIKKCGPLYLSEAIQLIEQHCIETYTDYETSIIQIHISGCLTLTKEPYDVHTNESYKTTPSLKFFDLHSVSDPKILDTPTTKVFVFIRHGIEFIIKIEKSSNDVDNAQFTSSLYYDILDGLFYALKDTIGLSINEMKDLPETIEITIPNAHSMTSREIKTYLREYFISTFIRSFKPPQVQPAPLPPPQTISIPPDLVVGDRVRVRDKVEENWKHGTVESTNPLMVRPDLWSQAQARWKFVERLTESNALAPPIVAPSIVAPPKAESNVLAPEPIQAIVYNMNDRVQVLTASGTWRSGKVTSIKPLKVLVDEWDTSYPFTQMRPIPPSFKSRILGHTTKAIDTVKRRLFNVSRRSTETVAPTAVAHNVVAPNISQKSTGTVGGKRKQRKQTRKQSKKQRKQTRKGKKGYSV